MPTNKQDYSAYYTKYQSLGLNNIAQFCREEQISYTNFLYHCTRQRNKSQDMPLSRIVLARSRKSTLYASEVSDIRIEYANGVSLQIGSNISLGLLSQLIRLP